MNVVAGVAAIASALTSFEAFESRFAKLGDQRFAATMILLVGSAVSATGADVRASGAACLLFLLAFYHIPEIRKAFPLLHLDDLQSVVDGVVAVSTNRPLPPPRSDEPAEEEPAEEEPAEEGPEEDHEDRGRTMRFRR